MPWTLTRDLDEFFAAAGDQLRAEPVLHNLPLTVLDSLCKRGPSAFGDDAPVYGWHEPADGRLDGAFLQTPPFPVLVAMLPAGSAADLITRLVAETGLPAAINLPRQDQADFDVAWAQVTGGSAIAGARSRLFDLERLIPPAPAPPGAARVAGPGDRELLIEWHAAFGQEAGTFADNAARTVDDRLSHAGLTLWEAGGLPVAMAGSTREVAGVVRIVGVYTVPAHRQRGYGGAVTAAASQAALDAGASAVVLFTDLANPTSNALYQRLGYRPIADRVVLRLTRDAGAGADGHARPAATAPDSTGPDSTGQIQPTPMSRRRHRHR
jgi:RimJ/RimL family protein N-acetyltransferase